MGEFGKVGGMGGKRGMGLVVDLLGEERWRVEGLRSGICRLKKEVKYWKVWDNIWDRDVWGMCWNGWGDVRRVCVVENIGDVMGVEKREEYGGVYDVVGGVIWGMEGIGG